ncbi:hypothetical protein ACFV5G_41950 [Streptomyces sp. NPDC059766]|uniref:hypothetical protein n=1 Tax=Streptomyces sp. NPDC059766 TaxID=3346940 RepID=UPI003650D263
MAIASGRVAEAHGGDRILGGNNSIGTERYYFMYGSKGAAGGQPTPGTTRLGGEGVRPMATVEDGSLHEGAQSRAGDGPLVTGCGRRIELRHLRIGRPDRPAHRIALAVGEARGGVPGAWAALSLDEARALGRLLLQEAGAEDSSDSWAGDLTR